MRKRLLVVATVAAFLVAAPAALADDGGSSSGKCQGQTTAPSIDTSQVQADISKLETDIQTRHHVLDADIQAVAADAQNGASADTLKADRAKTRSDFAANEAVVKQDRAKVRTDVKALIQAVAKGCGARKDARAQLRTLLKGARQAIRTELVGFRQENHQLRGLTRDAVKQDRRQHRKHDQGGSTEPTTTTTSDNG